MAYTYLGHKEFCVSGRILQPGEIEAAANIPPFLNLPGRDLFTVRAARPSTVRTVKVARSARKFGPSTTPTCSTRAT